MSGERLLAAAVAFAPSFSFILLGGGRFERLRGNERARGFLDGAGPAAIGAILGSAVTLAGALSEGWQIGVLAGAAIALLVVRRGIVETLVLAGAVGVGLALAGAPLPVKLAPWRRAPPRRQSPRASARPRSSCSAA